MARDKSVSTSPTTMGSHGRLHDEEAEREMGVTFADPDPRKAEQEAQKNRVMRDAMDRVAAQKPVAQPAETLGGSLNGPMLLSDVQAALSDRYPQHDIIPNAATLPMEVAVPTGRIHIDIAAVNKCKNTAELRAYIDSLVIQ